MTLLIALGVLVIIICISAASSEPSTDFPYIKVAVIVAVIVAVAIALQPRSKIESGYDMTDPAFRDEARESCLEEQEYTDENLLC
ncbi:hypothetical protein [Psychrobacter alimentarius]|uniref:hypothetical protein n=1 Tax=Psychrobacter alimentarius TaxID=261164 RepID=UPI003FD2DEF9